MREPCVNLAGDASGVAKGVVTILVTIGITIDGEDLFSASSWRSLGCAKICLKLVIFFGNEVFDIGMKKPLSCPKGLCDRLMLLRSSTLREDRSFRPLLPILAKRGEMFLADRFNKSVPALDDPLSDRLRSVV